IFGVGGRTLDEIDYVLNKYKDRDTTLMVGFQSYPSELQDIKLSRIKELKNKYPSSAIGYADHSSFDDEMAIISNDYAYILGARIFEKHITVDEGIERIDFQSAVGAKKISTIISRLTFLDKILNIDEADLFEMNAKEINYRNRQKIPVAKHNLEIGHMLTEEDIELKMIDTDNAKDDIELLINHKLKNKVMKDRAFLAKDLQ
ncbi:MAG: N-acetylneuraminate synthase family protein, partial [Gammaproteobacteria bacterium]|nr:N-acetylneuraminate synthase family protein [Gammaproteobacteria bacterium]